MYRSGGFRINPTHEQAHHIDVIRISQRYVYNWAVERLLADPTLTAYDLSNSPTQIHTAPTECGALISKHGNSSGAHSV